MSFLNARQQFIIHKIIAREIFAVYFERGDI